jgi:hypothetical protein
MKNSITSIRLHLIDDYTRIIKSLAARGRSAYQSYLIQPLSTWSKIIPQEPMEKLLEILRDAEENKSKRLPLIYKMAIVKSVSPEQLDMSIPGTISMNFLKSMKDIAFLPKSDEAIEFVNILSGPFRDFSGIEFKRLNQKFGDEISTAETVEVEKLIESLEGRDEDRAKIEADSQRHLETIKNLFAHGPDPLLRREIISYLLKFSTPTYPDMHHPVLEMIDSITRNRGEFKKEILDATAVIIYHEILKAIGSGQLKKAVTMISKYTVIFRGDPDTPNYQEVGLFEKKFFKIIEERNLWDRL